MALQTVEATRVLRAFRSGSSWPVLVETNAGSFVTKLIAAAQGPAALVAEIIVAALAEALDLPVPERVLVWFPEEIESDDRNDELAPLLAASAGLNLGFRHLPGAKDLSATTRGVVDDQVAARVLWLDAWVMNMDRSPANPNLLLWNQQAWLIDHGAALPFQHDWSALNEQEPHTTDYPIERHLFASLWSTLPAVDEALVGKFSLARLERVTALIPSEFLLRAFPREDPEVLRRAYAAFLWKRLKPPRPWLQGPS